MNVRTVSSAPSVRRRDALGSTLLRDVELLASIIGERHDGSPRHHDRLGNAAEILEQRFAAARWKTRLEGLAGDERRIVHNVEAERVGTHHPDEIVVVGAHYDSCRGGPGADDNATGVATLLALAAMLEAPLRRTVRLVAFANEEPPHRRRRTMGSLVYAENARARKEKIVAMLSLDCLGFHVRPEDQEGQRELTVVQRLFPVWTYGVFVVGNIRSRKLNEQVVTALRDSSDLPVHRVVAPEALPLARSSDHWSFWKKGFPAVMVTDGAPLRYRHYHKSTDTPDRVDVEAHVAITHGIANTVRSITEA